jgi:surface protein
MEGMFENCIKLTSLDLSNFNSKMIINMDSMFSGCKQLKFINFYNYNESSINFLNDIFYDTPKDLIICINKGTDLSLLTDHFTFEKCFITDCKFEEYIKRKKIYDSKECLHNCIDDDVNKY